MLASSQMQLKPRGNPFLGLTRWCAGFQRLFPSLRRRSALDGVLEHLGNLPLTAHASLALVRLHKDTLLLGITPQSITLLSKGVDPSVFATDRVSPETVALREEHLSQTENRLR
jgi:flagellar biogenesis protein FliO